MSVWRFYFSEASLWRVLLLCFVILTYTSIQIFTGIAFEE